MPRRYRGREIDGGEPRSGRGEARVDWLARGGRADAATLRANGRAGRQGIAGAGVLGCGGAVAVKLRYAAGCVCEGAGPSVGATAASLFVAACVRARAAREEIWTGSSAAAWADSGAFAGKYLGAGVEQCLSADGFAEAGAELRPDEDFART